MNTKKHIAIFVSFSGQGGVERVIANLTHGFITEGYAVDLLLVKALGAHLTAVHPSVNIIKLGSAHTLLCLWPLVRYLRQRRPSALLVAKNRANRVALWARQLAGVSTRIVVRMDTNLSTALAGQSRLRQLAYFLPIRWLYHLADGIVAVSAGVAQDLSRIADLPEERIQVIHNPVVTPTLSELAMAAVDHPWLNDSDIPTLIGVGRLTHQKDFGTLLRAVALASRQRPCRLIILGDGGERTQLEALAEELGISDRLSMPGFVTNPYAYLAKAKLFVLSSRWEGSPTVLIEALALGVPAVSTDCPSGPREILQDGKYGPLVPVGDPKALAAAIVNTLSGPRDPLMLKSAVADYTIEASTQRHLKVLGLEQ